MHHQEGIVYVSVVEHVGDSVGWEVDSVDCESSVAVIVFSACPDPAIAVFVVAGVEAFDLLLANQRIISALAYLSSSRWRIQVDGSRCEVQAYFSNSPE